jgi:mRNA interferase MazF
MKRRSVICDLGDIVVVPFPFVDVAAEKRRPSVVLSPQAFNRSNAHSICAMVTTAGRTKWLSDIAIVDLVAAGLPRPCVVRFKLFTLPNEIILRQAGALAEADRNNLLTAARTIML